MAVAKMLLERHGAVVQFERWGDTLEKRLTEFAPVDLILMDLMLAHGFDGYTLFEKIRTMPGFEQVPVVAFSASNPSEAIPRTRSMGFSGYIAKPLDFDAFPGQIQRLLNGEQLWIAR
ncbi:MAG: response regulator [Anaerolineae bacterium]|nr:response regulator [Anaerolineae bacterium]